MVLHKVLHKHPNEMHDLDQHEAAWHVCFVLFVCLFVCLGYFLFTFFAFVLGFVLVSLDCNYFSVHMPTCFVFVCIYSFSCVCLLLSKKEQ